MTKKQYFYDDKLSINPLAMKSGDKIEPIHPKHTQTNDITICLNAGHIQQIDMIGDLQVYCSNRPSAPSHKINQFKFCPYCGKKFKCLTN